MIAKSLSMVTHARIQVRDTLPPRKMLPLLFAYFKKEGVSVSDLSKWPFIPLDNLYLRNDCQAVMQVSLKSSE
jgi:hypothetical protein